MQMSTEIRVFKGNSQEMTPFDNVKVVTLGSLLTQDSPHAYILPERPSTFNHKATFVNDVRYVIHDYSANMSADHRHLKAMRACTVAGNELPILLTRDVNRLIKHHWSRWLPFFPTPDIRIFDQEDTGEKPLIVNFPFQSFPAKKHAVHPDIHYRLSSKARIPEMGAPCPRYMSRDDFTLPCMIKSTQGVGGRGVFIAQTKDDARAVFRELKNNFCCPEPVITDVIENISEFLNVQLYLFKNGDFQWLGVRRKLYSLCTDPSTADVDWDEQPELRKQVKGVTLPVMKYLHKNNYFGFIGVEILINNKGKFLIDVNLKTSDSTYLLLLAPHLAALNFPVCSTVEFLPKSIEYFLQAIDKLNDEEQGRIIVLSADECSKGKACVAVFGKNSEIAFRLHRRLLNLCSTTISDLLYDENRNPNELLGNESMDCH